MLNEPGEFPADEALVATIRARGGDAEGRRATNALLDRWQARIHRWIRQRVHDREEALDLTQDCLVLLVRGLPGYEPRGAFGAWVYTIVRHRCFSHFRRRRRERDVDVDPDDTISPWRGPEDEVAQRDRELRVRRAMTESLDEREQAALWLRAGEAMPVEEITRVLGLANATGARALLQTARRKLKAALDVTEGTT